MKHRVHAKHATVRCAGRTWHCSDCEEMFCQRRAARLHENFGCSDLRRRARQNVEAVDAGKHFTFCMLVHKCVATLWDSLDKDLSTSYSSEGHPQLAHACKPSSAADRALLSPVWHGA